MTGLMTRPDRPRSEAIDPCGRRRYAGAAGAVAALLLPFATADAQPARSQLAVGARVIPACQVATSAEAGAAPVAVTCSDDGPTSVSVERRVMTSSPSGHQDVTIRGNPRAEKSASATSDFTVITVTY